MKWTDTNQQISFLAAAVVLCAVVFTVWPEIDLIVSGWFFDPALGFWIADIWLVKFVREFIYGLMAFTLIGSLIMAVLGTLGFRMWNVPVQVWIFITSFFLIGPLWFTNAVLKNNWGRARPANISEFSGGATFTPALRWADECERNCSFVSGEGSGATALAVSMIVLAP